MIISMMASVCVPIALAIAVAPAIARAEPADAAPPPLVQPDVSAARSARVRTDLGWVDTGEGGATLLTERIELDWAWREMWLVSADLPLALGTRDVGTDPTYEFREVIVGNPSLLGRWRLMFAPGESRFEVVTSAGVMAATDDGERNPVEQDDGVWFVRSALESLHMIHRPYDFGFLTTVPLRADVRFSRGLTAVQGGVAVYTVIDHGDPEVDDVLATLAISHRLADVLEVAADLSVLTVPPSEIDAGSRTYVSLDIGAGKTIGAVNARVRFYLPDLPEPWTGRAIALDLAHRFD